MIVYDGIVRYPRIARYSTGGQFMFEVVVCRSALDKLSVSNIFEIEIEEKVPILLTLGLDGVLTMRGFPREVYSQERAQHEAILILEKFRDELGIDLALVETDSLIQH